MPGAFADQLESVARELRAQADGGLRRELDRGFRDAVEPVMPRIREGLKPRLPDPYAGVLDGDLNLRVQVRTARDPGVSLVASTRSRRRRALGAVDRGVLAHPLWGNRRRWSRQRVTAGFFTGPARDDAEQVRAALQRVLDDAADAVDRKAAR